MDIIRPDQYVIIILFLGILGILWLWVRMNKAGLNTRINQGKRIKISEVSAITPLDRVMIIKVDEKEYLIFKSKGLTPVITEIKPEEVTT